MLLFPNTLLHSLSFSVTRYVRDEEGDAVAVMLPTPSTSHVNTERIYEPSEDSFLFLDTLSSASETGFLTQRFGIQADNDSNQSSPVVLEVGTGSGVVLAFVCAQAQTIFGRTDVLAFGTDINRFACGASRETVKGACADSRNGGLELGKIGNGTQLLAVMEADLTSPFRPGTIDMLLFNPPYVPSEEVPLVVQSGSPKEEANAGFDHDSHLLSLSYEGGKEGMEVTNRLLGQLPDILNKDRGVAYILLCHQNRPAVVIKMIKEWGPSWSVEIVGKSGKQAGWEKLVIIRVSRNK